MEQGDRKQGVEDERGKKRKKSGSVYVRVVW